MRVPLDISRDTIAMLLWEREEANWGEEDGRSLGMTCI